MRRIQQFTAAGSACRGRGREPRKAEASSSRKRQGKGSPLEPPERNAALWHLDCSLCGTFNLQTV